MWGPVDEAKNKTSPRSSSLLLRVLLAVGGCGLFMGLLIFAILGAILLPPYLLGLVVDPQQCCWVTSGHDVFAVSIIMDDKLISVLLYTP